MRKNILCIDFSIFANKYLDKFSNIDEFNYWLRDCEYPLAFDFNFFDDLFTSIYQNIKNFKKEDVHFFFRQEDIIYYLKEEPINILYNIDFFSDMEDYTTLVGNNSWVKFALDNNYAQEYRWIHSMASLQNKYSFSLINELNFNILNEVDKIFICLSPEYIKNDYHALFYNLRNTIGTLLDNSFDIEERLWDWNPFPEKPETENKYTYCTLLTSESYLDAVVALNYCLNKVGTKYPLLVLCSNVIAPETLTLLETYNIKYQLFKDLRDNLWDLDFYNPTLIDYNSKVNKIYSFLLKDYEKVLYLDADIIPLKNLDYLFDTIIPENIVTKEELLDKHIFLVPSYQEEKDNYIILEPTNTNILHFKGENKYWFNKPLKDVLNYIDIVYQVNDLIKENTNGAKTG